MTTTPDTDRQARRDKIRRMARLSLTPAGCEALSAAVEAEFTDGDQAREQLAAARAGDAPWIKAYREDLTAEHDTHEQHRTALAAALYCPEDIQWGRLISAAKQTAAGRRTWRDKAHEMEADAVQARQGEAEAVRAREAAEAERDASNRFAEASGTRAYRADAEARRNRDAWRNARRRAALMTAEVTRRAPLTGEYAARARTAEIGLTELRKQLDLAEISARANKTAITEITERAERAEAEQDEARHALKLWIRAAGQERERAERAEATLTAVRTAVAAAIEHANPLNLDCHQCPPGVDHLATIVAALGDPQPATEAADTCAHRSWKRVQLPGMTDALGLTGPRVCTDCGEGLDRPAPQREQPAEPPSLAAVRQPAYDAVYAYIRRLGDHLPPDPVHRNAIIWRGVNAALDAITPAAEPCAHGCRQAADDLTRLGQEIDAEAEQPAEPEPDAPCFHPSWETEPTVGARKCTDCGEWLDPEPPAEPVGAALWATIRDHAARDHQFWTDLNRDWERQYRQGVRL